MKRGWFFLFVLVLVNLSFVSSAVLFESDWSTGIGTNDSVLRDTNKVIPWPIATHTDGRLQIVNATSEGLAGWPSANAARVYLATTNVVGWFRIPASSNIIPILPIEGWRYYRFYFQLHTPDGFGYYTDLHTVEQNIGGWGTDNGNWVWGPNYAAKHGNGKWETRAPRAQGNLINKVWPDFGPYHQPSPYLDKKKTYRFELAQHRINETTYKMNYRVYNSSDVLIWDDNNILNDNEAKTYAQIDPTYTFHDINETQELQVGLNGFSNGNETYPFTWGYYGAVCIRDDDWCGAYNASQGGGGGQNDSTPATRSLGSPSGLLPYNTTQTTLSLTTNEIATCKYGTTANTIYASIANNFSTTGNTIHQQTLTGLTFNTTYNYYVRCNDTSNNVNTNDFNITFRISHGPDFTYNWNDWWTNETINFSLYNATHLQNISNVKFVNQYGRIQFLQNLNLSSDLNLAERIKVLDKKIWINSSLIPQFNKSAQLTFTGVGFSNPIIKIDGVDCPDTKCQNVTFNQTSGQYTFNVTSFSVYEIVEQCEDNVKNYDETGKDCGGKCGECKGNSWVWVLIGVLALGVVVYLFGMRKRRKRREKSKKILKMNSLLVL